VSRNTSTGGTSIQVIIDSGVSFDRGGVFHNARWNHVSQLWEVDAIGANDTHAVLFKNNGGVDFIFHSSTGNTSRTFTHANFLNGKKMGIDASGNLFLLGQIEEEGWTDATLQNSWAHYGSPFANAGFYKDKQGVVHLRGVIRNGVTTTNTVLFTLPAGYRPPTRKLIATQSNGSEARFDIATNGDVLIQIGSSTWFSFENCSFRTT
jgi:hypothetical protein